jgi:ParB family transcriptional regulator, chromosome partitioning protein
MTQHDADHLTISLKARGGRPRGLGRGLGALIPRSTAGLVELELAQIRPNPEQPRLAIDEAALEELAASIREHGLLQPILVSQADDEPDSYVLIAGERRWRAAQRAGLRTIPALVKQAAPRARLELALVENVQREDLTPLELATAYRALIDEHGLTQEQVARRVGKSRTAVSNTVRLLGLPPPARAALADGRLSEGHARALLGAPNETTLLATLDQTLATALSVRETEELVRRSGAGRRETGVGRRASGVGENPTPSPEGGPAQVGVGFSPAASRPLLTDSRLPTPASPAPDIAYLEERLRQQLGTKVQLLRARQGGRLVIHFFSDEELRGLYQRLCGEELD